MITTDYRNFQDLVNKLAFSEGLPFNVQFSETPFWGNVPYETVTIEGFQFPKFNSLLPIEDWFFTYLANKRQEKMKDIGIKSGLLVNRCKQDLNLENIDQANNILFEFDFEEIPKDWDNTKRALLSSQEYANFLESNAEDIGEIAEQLVEFSNDQSDKWLRITMFLNTRVKGLWEVGNVAMLPVDLDKIDEFIILEGNKGVDLTDLESPEPEEPREGKKKS